MKQVITITLLTLLLPSVSFAQTGETQLYSEFNKADKELNLVYIKLKNNLGQIDRTALIEAQRAWITFRDSNCSFISQEKSEGGVISNKMNIACKTQTTLERIKELKSILEEGF